MSPDMVSRIRELLENPSREHIASSQWILMHAISLHKTEGASLGQIVHNMAKLLKKTREVEVNRNFFLMWSTGHDLENVLIEFTDMKLLELHWRDEEPVWVLTEKGSNLLRNRADLAPAGF